VRQIGTADILVVTPYNGQVNLLKSVLPPKHVSALSTNSRARCRRKRCRECWARETANVEPVDAEQELDIARKLLAARR
jgi:hypothetical protein